VLLAASRLAGPGEVRWRGLVRLDATLQSRYRHILEQAAASLGLQAGGPGAPPLGTDAGHAGILFLDSPEFLEAVERSLLESAGEDVRLLLAPASEGASARFVFNANLFKKETIERAAGHLRALLAHGAADAEIVLSQLRLLTAQERGFIASVCEGRPRSQPSPLVHRSFEARAAEQPHATAVRFKDASLSYGRLNARANAFARRLVAEGVGAETRVAVYLEPSLEVPLALLAILKAGGVYVPLDPTHPEARLRAQLQDIRPLAIITRKGLAEKLGPTQARTIAIEDLETLTAGLAEDDLDLPIESGQTAYVYFTSGTTGAPKGAMASCANLAAYIAAARERFQIVPSDVIPAIARFTFSISMFELMSPLAAGGALVILERDHVIDPERMAKTLQGVTLFHAGPSLLRGLLAHIRSGYGDFTSFSGVRHASSGGDMVPPELLEGLKEVFPSAEVFVIYGCSEISCMGCTYPVPRDRAVERTYVGRPFDGVSVRVLDPAFNELPAGVAGEICFSGDGLIKGYLDRPELTAERFVDIGGRRFYRTGDIGRLSDDGWLEILGRSDFQVKIRGMRVEPAEVEHFLRGAPGVREGVVMPFSAAGGEKALAAYVVLDKVAAPGASGIEAVRAHMELQLPDYMLPTAYVELEKLPLNHNMKLDRKALPPPPEKALRRHAGARVRPPRGETETRLAGLWSTLLGTENVGLDDRFFDLGGDSALGIQLIANVKRELGVPLKGLDVVRETLEGMARLCDEKLGRAPVRAAGGPPTIGGEPLRFGPSGELYGVLTGNAAAAGRAALICPPLGQDYVRSRFILQRLAARLSSHGVPSLLFDFYASGDSFGDAADGGLARWRGDVVEAFRELKRRAGSARVTAVGARLGAAPLLQAARELDLSSIVLWDPVLDGAAYVAEAAELHQRFVGGWRRLFWPPAPVRGCVELLGLTFEERTARELSDLRLSAQDASAQVRSLALEAKTAWCDLEGLGDQLPDAGVSETLARLVLEAP
jgi:amino acid adenylation domain-containing protein